MDTETLKMYEEFEYVTWYVKLKKIVYFKQNIVNKCSQINK